MDYTREEVDLDNINYNNNQLDIHNVLDMGSFHTNMENGEETIWFHICSQFDSIHSSLHIFSYMFFYAAILAIFLSGFRPLISSRRRRK